MWQSSLRGLFAVFVLCSGCSQAHTAFVRAQALPPPPEPTVRHSSPLWIDLFPGVSPTECVTPKGNRELCFAEVDQALSQALERSLWTSFPRVQRLGRFDQPAPSDYVLKIELSLSALPPGNEGPGWSALAKGRFRLERDGKPVASEALESRSRAEFAYGGALGAGASEVVSAIASHVGMALGGLPETRPDQPTPLPAVVAQSAKPEQAALSAKQ